MVTLMLLEASATTTQTFMDILTVIDSVVEIIVNIFVIIGGICGLNYIKKLREKQSDSVFGYLTKLRVRINCINQIFINNCDDITELFINVSNRRIPSANKIQSTYDAAKVLSKNASETLIFLMNEDDQIPAQKGWTKNLNFFISFLIDCEQLKNPTFFKWTNRDEHQKEIDNYIEDHIKCMNKLLKMISKCQTSLEDKLYKRENNDDEEEEVDSAGSM